MSASPTWMPYEMPCPVADYYDPEHAPTATFAEDPPEAILSVASSLMEAGVDTSCCASCGAPIGFVLVEVRDRYDSGIEKVQWVTPWLVVDRSGAPAAVCEDCSEDEAPPNPPPTGETTMEETITTDDYRVRTWPARNLTGRRGWKYQVDYLGAWDTAGDHRPHLHGGLTGGHRQGEVPEMRAEHVHRPEEESPLPAVHEMPAPRVREEVTGSDEIGGPMVDESETATLCITCEEDEGQPNECPKSGRPCGHHCNHTWTHDSCCWCDAEFGESA